MARQAAEPSVPRRRLHLGDEVTSDLAQLAVGRLGLRGHHVEGGVVFTDGKAESLSAVKD